MQALKIKSLTIVILVLFCIVIADGQSKPSKPTPKPTSKPARELTKLRDSYIKTTNEYKASLQRLLVLYQASVRKAEQRMAQLQELYKEGLLSKPSLDESEHALTVEKGKVQGVEDQIAAADTQIAQTLIELENDKTIAKLAREYKRASTRQPRCRNWTLTASRQERGGTVTFAFKLVCKD